MKKKVKKLNYDNSNSTFSEAVDAVRLLLSQRGITSAKQNEEIIKVLRISKKEFTDYYNNTKYAPRVLAESLLSIYDIKIQQVSLTITKITTLLEVDGI